MKYYFPHVSGEAEPDITKVSGWSPGLIRVQVRRHEFSLDSIILDFVRDPEIAAKLASEMNLR